MSPLSERMEASAPGSSTTQSGIGLHTIQDSSDKDPTTQRWSLSPLSEFKKASSSSNEASDLDASDTDPDMPVLQPAIQTRVPTEAVANSSAARPALSTSTTPLTNAVAAAPTWHHDEPTQLSAEQVSAWHRELDNAATADPSSSCSAERPAEVSAEVSAGSPPYDEALELLQKARKLTALRCGAEFFSSGPPGRDAWKTVRDAALERGVELSMTSSVVKARSLCTHPSRRRYAGDNTEYTFAETLEFVFSRGGNFAFALKMWTEDMLPPHLQH